MSNDALAQIILAALKSNPELQGALNTTPVKDAELAPITEVSSKSKKKESLWRNVRTYEISEYFHIEVSVKRCPPREDSKDKRERMYAKLDFTNPKKGPKGRGSYGHIWGFKSEIRGLINWVRSAVVTQLFDELVKMGLTDAVLS